MFWELGIIIGFMYYFYMDWLEDWGYDELFGLQPEPCGEVGLNPPTGNIGMGAAAEELQGAVGCKCVEGGLGPFGR